VYRLLIPNGYSSHAPPDFDQYCEGNRIITLYMPPHTSHLLQPLNVGCFAVLKAVYRLQVAELARQGVFYIDKLDFLYNYTKTRPTVLSEQHIKAGFEAIGLILACLETHNVQPHCCSNAVATKNGR
jgi:hypothetical protein